MDLHCAELSDGTHAIRARSADHGRGEPLVLLHGGLETGADRDTSVRPERPRRSNQRIVRWTRPRVRVRRHRRRRT